MEENKELLQLLEQIEKNGRKQVRIGRIQSLLMLVAVVCCAGAVVLVLHFLPQIAAVVDQMEVVLGNLERTTGELAALDLQSMVKDVDTLVVTGQESLEQTMAKLNTLDFEALNQAIQDLGKVVEPLAKLFKAF